MKPTFGIIGYGRFGRLWARHLSRLGKVFVADSDSRVLKTGRNIIPTTPRQAARAEVVFLAVPISQLGKCCREIKNFLPAKSIVADVSSVKLYSAAILKKTLPKRQPLIATHPLFGPDSAGKAKTLKGFKIVLVPVRATSGELKYFKKILRRLNLTLLRTTALTHDKQMANSQGLVHFIGRGLTKLNLRPQQIATPDYLGLLRLKEMVVHDTRQLFFDMQKYNRYVSPVRHKFLLDLIGVENAIGQQGSNLAGLRGQINQLDQIIVKTIAERIGLAKKVGYLKKRGSLKIKDAKRERQLEKWHKQLSRQHGLDGKEILKIFSPIMQYSRNIQK